MYTELASPLTHGLVTLTHESWLYTVNLPAERVDAYHMFFYSEGEAGFAEHVPATVHREIRGEDYAELEAAGFARDAVLAKLAALE